MYVCTYIQNKENLYDIFSKGSRCLIALIRLQSRGKEEKKGFSLMNQFNLHT